MDVLQRLANVIDRLCEGVGRAVSWLILAIVVITFAIVVLRYGFGWGRIWMQESYVWINGIAFLLSAPFTLLKDGHVRVDIFYRAAGTRSKAIIDALGVVFLLLPTMAVFAYVSWPYILQSWKRFEASREANGLPGLFLVKSVLLVFVLLLALQGVSLLIRSLSQLRNRPQIKA